MRTPPRISEGVGALSYGVVMYLTSEEVERFWSHVIKGPRPTSCWLWAGAVADDSYGRFWVSRQGQQRVLRPHRVAWALAAGVSVDLVPVVEHLVCDNPICVRAEGTLLDHLEGSTQSANLSRIVRGDHALRGYSGRLRSREAMYRRSLALRAATADGWDDDRIAAALMSLDEDQPTLF